MNILVLIVILISVTCANIYVGDGDVQQQSKIKALYDSADFIVDYQNEKDFLKIYQSLLQRLSEYVVNRERDLMYEERMLTYLFTAGRSKSIKLRRGTQQTLMIDIMSYLSGAIEHIKQMENTGTHVALRQILNQCRYKLDGKLEENHTLILKNILPGIQKLNIRINSKIEKLLNHLLKVKNSTIIYIDPHSQAVAKLQKSVDQSVRLNFLKIVTGIVSYLNLFSSVVNIEIRTANAFKFDYDNQLKDFYFQIEKPKEHKTELIILNILDEILVMAAHFSFDDIAEQALKVINGLSAGQRLDTHDIELLQNNFQSILQKKIDELKANSYQNDQHALRALAKMKTKLSVLEMNVDIFNTFRKDKHKLNEIEVILRHSQNRLKKLKIFERQCVELVDPMVKYMHKLFNGIAVNVTNGTTSDWVRKLYVQNTLKDLRFRMKKIITELKFKGDLLHTFDKLDVVFINLISIYDEAELYQQHLKLSAYITKIELLDFSLGVQHADRDLEKLHFITQSNVLLTIFGNAVNAVKQTIFPLAGHHFHRFNLQPQLAVDETIKSLVQKTTTELMNLKLFLMEYNSFNNTKDSIIHTVEFVSHLESSKPFYVWTGKQHNKVITQLLSGNAVTVNVDITKGLKENAVKYQFLQIYLRTGNQTTQAMLDRILESFDVTIVHHGNSYYRCNNKFYLIESPSQRIEYSFENVNGFPKRMSNAYQKMIENCDFTLSPYALLTISITPQNPVDLKTLFAEFGGSVDLELIGRAQYVNSRYDVCQGIEKYYTADESVGLN